MAFMPEHVKSQGNLLALFEHVTHNLLATVADNSKWQYNDGHKMACKSIAFYNPLKYQPNYSIGTKDTLKHMIVLIIIIIFFF